MITAIDLFSGLGGFSEGARQAGVTVLWAANHWHAAVEMHKANHQNTAHACQDLQQADWRECPSHDILLASPACQGHSRARGKERPHHDAQRATAFAVLAALEFHRPAAAVIENVPEFRAWALYQTWTHGLTALGYSMSEMVLDAADFGVPQHRKRLFVVCTRSRSPIKLEVQRHPHLSIDSFIDWTNKYAWSSTADKREKTQRRIANALAAFGPRFVMPYYGSGSGLTGRCLSRPLGTISTRDRWAIVDRGRMRMFQPEELKAAMGFPAHYRLPAARAKAVHMLGNAVCPPVAAAIMSDLLKRL